MAAVGITMLAGLGVGVYRDRGEAIAAACHPADPVLPDRANQDRYADLYERYRSVVASDLAVRASDLAGSEDPDLCRVRNFDLTCGKTSCDEGDLCYASRTLWCEAPGMPVTEGHARFA